MVGEWPNVGRSPYLVGGPAALGNDVVNYVAIDICEAEIKAGKLPPITSAVGFELVGTTPANAQPYALFFMPYATSESLGISSEPDNHRPWLMSAGRINAHIMGH